MANLKDEIVDAAVAWGFGERDALDQMTKEELLQLWEGRDG